MTWVLAITYGINLALARAPPCLPTICLPDRDELECVAPEVAPLQPVLVRDLVVRQRLSPKAPKLAPRGIEALRLPVIVTHDGRRHEQAVAQQPAQRLYRGDVEVAVEVDDQRLPPPRARRSPATLPARAPRARRKSVR